MSFEVECLLGESFWGGGRDHEHHEFLLLKVLHPYIKRHQKSTFTHGRSWNVCS